MTIQDNLFWLSLLVVFICTLVIARVFSTKGVAALGAFIIGLIYGKYLYQKGFKLWMGGVGLCILAGYVVGNAANFWLILVVLVLSSGLGYFGKKKDYL